jgi:hypothetical protein
MDGPNTMHYTITQGGKPYEEGTYILAADGRKMTDSYRMARHPQQEHVIVYDKQ